MILAATSLAIAYLTLMPNNGHTRFRLVPLPLYRWLATPEHDRLMNVIAFGFLALVALVVGKKPVARGNGMFGTIVARRGASWRVVARRGASWRAPRRSARARVRD